jgi:hypothetical protein
MNKIERFEDILSWQKARVMTKEIYASTRTGQFARDYGLKDQIQRATVSTMANIAEGFERGGDREFVQFYVALDQGYVTQVSFDQLYAKADEVSRLVGGFMHYLRQSQLGGPKYKGRA